MNAGNDAAKTAPRAFPSAKRQHFVRNATASPPTIARVVPFLVKAEGESM